MKIFHDSGKTFLPRIDRIYLHTRGLTVAILSGWLALTNQPQDDLTVLLATIGALALHFGVLLYLNQKTRVRLQGFYLGSILMDAVILSLWVSYTGGYDSSFYIGYYMIVAFGAYLLAQNSAIILSTIISALYIALVWDSIEGNAEWLAVATRLGPSWIFLAVIAHVAEHMRRSEGRMLKLFDTLNMRTAELEKIQAQLESIYDNSRILASILDIDEVIKSVMQIVNGVLKYPSAALLMRQGESGFIYRGRVMDGEINLRLKAAKDHHIELLQRVARAGVPVRINDINSRDDYQPMKEGARSVMMAPMTVRRDTVGVLVAESTVKSAFSERDEKMLLVVARSAAMSLDNAVLHQEMEELTITDALTGAFNYRYFTSKLSEEQRRASRYDQPLSLIMIDIDHFKNFNDTYGHEAGNIALKGVSDVIAGCVRDTDIFARYGGEEFSVILPQTSKLEARRIANRIRESIERTRLQIGDGLPRQSLTVSVGLTCYPENGKSQNELLHLADQALYRAKGEGRNIVQEI